MSKATSKAASKPKEEKPLVDEGAIGPEASEAPATMSKKAAQETVDKYSGINGEFVPDELKKAREVLKGQ